MGPQRRSRSDTLLCLGRRPMLYAMPVSGDVRKTRGTAQHYLLSSEATSARMVKYVDRATEEPPPMKRKTFDDQIHSIAKLLLKKTIEGRSETAPDSSNEKSR